MAAKIRIQKVDGEAERLMCIGLIASDKVIKQLAPIMSPDILESKCAQSLAAWSLDYFKEFGAAPKLHIQDIFESKKRNFLDDDVADLIERMLVSINEQMHDQTDLNEDYIIVECEKLIKSRKAKMLAEDITAYLSKGQVLEAEEAIRQHQSPSQTQARPLRVDHLQYIGTNYVANEPDTIPFLFENSMPRACLGILAGSPGVGKSTFAHQLAVALAAGTEAFDDILKPRRAHRAVFITAEEPQLIVNRRMHFALNAIDDEDTRAEAAKRICAISVQGDVSLCTSDRHSIKPTQNYNDLRSLIAAFKPKLVLLDTWGRFAAVKDENDNAAITAACGLLEALIQEFGVNIIVLHHFNKISGDIARDQKALDTALSASSIRGGGSLVACARWAAVLVPLGDELAGKTFGTEAGKRPPGTFVGFRVVKKNVGAPEKAHFLLRGHEGLLCRAVPNADGMVADVEIIQAEIMRRANKGEPPLAGVAGYKAMKWGRERYKQAVEHGKSNGLFKVEKNEDGKGQILKNV